MPYRERAHSYVDVSRSNNDALSLDNGALWNESTDPSQTCRGPTRIWVCRAGHCPLRAGEVPFIR